jgi:predicted deacylase
VIPGTAKLHPGRVVGPEHWGVVATRTGLWLPGVHAGENVTRGQVLGRMVDEFGALLQTFEAPADGIIEYVCTSPAIDSERHPHDSPWHQLVIHAAADPAR